MEYDSVKESNRRQSLKIIEEQQAKLAATGGLP
jgi:hypothetical protein